MSTSDREATDFDLWLGRSFARLGSFTALVVLIRIEEPRVEPLASSWFHVIGDEADWMAVARMFANSGVRWDGAAFFPTQGIGGGPAPDAVARDRLRELEARLVRDRLILNEGEFFDVWGRSLKVEEVTPRRLDG